ncbi:hypothetical protein CEPID_02115 [Corynebacterium epidermidicanis]|uniref:Uncharacterized protein n=1 Tax=Corynebacterium epidermidicanis TaxID=1050174 RepID=A0A0G3GMD5_9CORY|nr:hypothetical protein CEPID_02115 [Corynebacterium epidermidicanis]
MIWFRHWHAKTELMLERFRCPFDTFRAGISVPNQTLIHTLRNEYWLSTGPFGPPVEKR